MFPKQLLTTFEKLLIAWINGNPLINASLDTCSSSCWRRSTFLKKSLLWFPLKLIFKIYDPYPPSYLEGMATLVRFSDNINLKKNKFICSHKMRGRGLPSSKNCQQKSYPPFLWEVPFSQTQQAACRPFLLSLALFVFIFFYFTNLSIDVVLVHQGYLGLVDSGPQ